MSPAAATSFSSRWARDNLARSPTHEELRLLDMVLSTCGGDEAEAARRARRYYRARGPPPHGLKVWTSRRPDDEDILSSCQDAYIVPLRVRSVAGRRLTLVRLPAPTALDRPLSIQALIARWLMILDIRVREEASEAASESCGTSEEVMLVDVCDLQASHFKRHFRGHHWRDFFYCIRSAHPKKFSEIHIVNTHKLKAMSLLLLRAGLYPWRRKVTQVHARAEQLNQVLGADYFPVEGLPYEYGGKEGTLKDLNDEWTKKLLSNAAWLEGEARRFSETELKAPNSSSARPRGLSEVRIPALRSSGRGSYPVLRRSRSERNLREDNLDNGAHGHYRSLKVPSDHGFYG